MNPFEHQVRERAYFIWEGEGRVIGNAEAHWLRAENELHRAAGPLVVQASTADITAAPSPAVTLDKTLKAKASRTRSATAKADEKAKAPAKSVKALAKSAAVKSATAKSATKAPTAKAPVAKVATTKPVARAKAPRSSAGSSASIH
ncbi:DUF2934 domain-containing protein [Methylobacterium sp. BTF04]|uniref:DUF2934 domain-containing protein n=1 Tax=Methylobacterium sp. BTF04 TaxID=2708300 RepID=UPI0013D25DEF|nr:DUF2934 domain-containing protein [Methylobacterium sp. BTF04]NEU13741.1 DUF2934 domain-containing protein [Methylobacterium sp. BTF04]